MTARPALKGESEAIGLAMSYRKAADCKLSGIDDLTLRQWNEVQRDRRFLFAPQPSEHPDHDIEGAGTTVNGHQLEHKGVDERGLIRAMIANLARSGRPQGGSTITQQVVKNLLVGDDVTYERKMREVIIASRVERSLTKAEILETYLNSIYLGRGAWGIELAARTYFGKPAAALTVTEGAMLAGLTKGPTYYSPDRHPDRAQERLAYVLARMQEDGDAAAGSGQERPAADGRL